MTQEETESDRSFKITSDRTTAEETYRHLCLSPAHNPNGYVSFGRWLAVNAPNISTLKRKNISNYISEVKHICEDWDQIR